MEFNKLNICYEDLKNICRICLCFGNLEPFKELSVYNVYQSIKSTDTKIEVEEKLPKKVCQNCVRDLENVSKFLLKCKNSDIFLKSIINQKLDEDTPNESKICSSGDKIHTSVSENICYITANSDVLQEVKIKKEMENSCNEDNISDVDSLNLKLESENINTSNKLFSCDYCSKTFERIFHLQEHINIHLGLKPFKCNSCGKCFAKRQSLRAHCVNIHNIILNKMKQPRRISMRKTLKDVKTNGKIFMINNLDKENSFICNVCGKKYRHRNSWKYHVSTHIYEKLFKCSSCDWQGINKDNLDTHFNESHMKMDTNNLPEIIGIKDEKAVTMNKMKTKTLNEKAVTSSPHFLCSICGKTFTRKSTLYIHLKIHSGEKKFECNICGFRFILKCTLDRHLAVHNNEKQYKCNICGKRFSQKRYLPKHIKAFHGTEKKRPPLKKEENISHFCSVCGNEFATKRSLRHHESVHKTRENTSEDTNYKVPKSKDTKDFLCTECGKQFTFNCNLQRHILITHSGEKPFECSVCCYRFTAKSSLDHHLNIHNGVKPYQCKQCQKSFRQPSSLRKHILVHTGERRFKCHVCEMAFKTSSHLNTHMKRHTRP